MQFAAVSLASLTLSALSFAPLGDKAAQDTKKPVLDYEAMAKKALVAHGFDPKKGEAPSFDDIVSQRFFHLQLGSVDVYLPAAEAKTVEQGKDYVRSLTAIVKVQREWLRWTMPDGAPASGAPVDGGGGGRGGTGPGKGLSEAPDKYLEVLEKWVSSISPSAFGRLKVEKESDLGKALDPNAQQTDALKHAAEFMTSGGPLGLDMSDRKPARVVIVPSRAGFCELMACAGYTDPTLREYFWLPSLDIWTEGRVNDWRILSLTLAQVNGAADDYTDAVRLDEKDKSGVEQFAGERAALALIYQALGDNIGDVYASGLAMNLVIGALGQDNTRSEGDLRGKSVPPIEVFIPGGASEGGTLPAPNLESKWREHKGTDWFVPNLKQAQKSGREKAKDRKKKHLTFLITGDDGKGTHVIEAPFFGEAAKGKPMPPKDFQGDYLEFFRAYKVAFLRWLARDSAADPKEAARRFAKVLAQVGSAQEPGEFERAVTHLMERKVFADAEDDVETSVEGAFLRWLGK